MGMTYSGVLKTVCAIVLALAAAIPAAARTSFPAKGGTGDHAMSIECGDGEYLVGFAGRVGSWIDRIQPLCAGISADGRRGSINYNIRTAGGRGGSPAEFSCPADSFIYATTATVRNGDQFLTKVAFDCFRPLDAQFPPSVTFGGSSEGYVMGKETCSAGELGTGINVRYGKDVNAFGLICDTLVIPAKAAPPPAAPPPTSASASAMEAKTDRPGNDYTQFSTATAQACQSECLNDGKCLAWTWVQPGWQAADALCYLKNGIPDPTANECCTSGTIRR